MSKSKHLMAFATAILGLCAHSWAYAQNPSAAERNHFNPFIQDTYLGAEYTETTSSSGFRFSENSSAYIDDLELPEIEDDQTSFFFHMAPGMGASGVSAGWRMTVEAGVSGSININNLGIDTNNNDRFTDPDDLRFTGTLKYEESLRTSFLASAHWSFARRFHPYIMSGYSYSVVEADIVGVARSSRCGSTSFGEDSSEYTVGGLTYGAGLLMNFSKHLALSASYKVSYLDFEYSLTTCRDTDHEIASFDSNIESYGIGLAFTF